MTDPISALGRAIAAVRTDAKSKESTGFGQGVRAGAAAAASAPTRPQPQSLASLPARLRAQRLTGQPGDRKQILRLFVESVLLDSLGHELTEDPEFGELIDRVANVIDGQAELTDQVTLAISDLLAVP